MKMSHLQKYRSVMYQLVVLAPIFKKMFSDSEIAAKYSCGRTKVSWKAFEILHIKTTEE